MKLIKNFIYSYYHRTRVHASGSIVHKLHQRICSSEFIANKIFHTKISPLILNEKRGFQHLFDITSIIIRNLLRASLSKKTKKKILDLGTGRYAVLSIFLKKMYPDCMVIASDVNNKFINHSIINCEYNKVDVKCVKSNLYHNIDARDFDLIIWNLPYYEDPNTYLGTFFKESIDRMSSNGELMLGFNAYATTAKQIEDILDGFEELFIFQIKDYSWNNHKIIIIRKST